MTHVWGTKNCVPSGEFRQYPRRVEDWGQLFLLMEYLIRSNGGTLVLEWGIVSRKLQPWCCEPFASAQVKNVRCESEPVVLIHEVGPGHKVC